MDTFLLTSHLTNHLPSPVWTCLRARGTGTRQGSGSRSAAGRLAGGPETCARVWAWVRVFVCSFVSVLAKAFVGVRRTQSRARKLSPAQAHTRNPTPTPSPTSQQPPATHRESADKMCSAPPLQRSNLGEPKQAMRLKHQHVCSRSLLNRPPNDIRFGFKLR